MALVGSLKVLKQQTQKSRLIAAIEYLENTDIKTEFKDVSAGNNKIIELNGKTIFAIYQTYESKPHNEIKVEGHKKYIDIQYIFEGNEQILLASPSDILKEDNYNEEKDIYFPKIKAYSIVQLKPGDGAILFPEDLHGPGYCVQEPGSIKKIVIKVAVD